LARVFAGKEGGDNLAPYGGREGAGEQRSPYEPVPYAQANKAKSQFFVTPTTTTGTDKDKADQGQVPLKHATGNPPFEKATSLAGRAMSDAEIRAALAKPGSFQRFREMVVMHLRKGDWSTQLTHSLQLDHSRSSTALGEAPARELILPMNSFKQCLQVAGVRASQAQVSKFVVRGNLSGYERGEARSPMAGRTPPSKPGDEQGKGLRQIKSSASLARPRIKAQLTESGAQSLGVNVKDFLSYYT
jgi:hypothetical protein